MTSANQSTWEEFRETINMTATELQKWLSTDESQQVGQKSGTKESTGHASRRHIVAILKAKKSDLTDEDYAHMRKVVGHAKRQLAQRPNGDARRPHGGIR
jgi:ribosomal protein L11